MRVSLARRVSRTSQVRFGLQLMTTGLAGSVYVCCVFCVCLLPCHAMLRASVGVALGEKRITASGKGS